ncbi:tetratricopeptide repeat protein [Robiginitalea sediminis]|uniref:tetratricopeptide repeat protein n=1 Tax=Robiginitalea sediminis TaxID=1982593 RepID=UPI00117B54E5|nr:tetratricopeptide repeat protein [Robiginitalea sediminis]
METFQETIQALTQKGRFSEAASFCRDLLLQEPQTINRVQVATTLAHLLAWEEDREAAEAVYRELLDSLAEGERAYRASTCNNLGELLRPSRPKEAIECFDQALALYSDLGKGNDQYRMHLGNTLMARGSTYEALQKFGFAKKDYKAALEVYNGQPGQQAQEMRALARYQLGGVYMEEFNAFDARVHYTRACERYKELLEANPGSGRESFLPMLAATWNNLALAERDAEQYERASECYREAIKSYGELSADRPEVFLPYLAQSYSGMGILLAEKFRHFEEALDYNQKALDIYEDLSAKQPEQYSHYRATAWHNAGVYWAELRNWQAAEQAFDHALEARRKLEEAAPGTFTADLGSTAMNLLELYRERLEDPELSGYRERAMELSTSLQGWLAALQGGPVIRNMKADLELLTSYFSNLDESGIAIRAARKEQQALMEEIDSTLEVAEKKGYQARILDIWRGVQQNYTAHPQAVEGLVLALSNMAWLETLSGNPELALSLLDEAAAFEVHPRAVLCNRAHCHLLIGQADKANTMYRELWNQTHPSGESYGAIINRDLWSLLRHGRITADQLPSSDSFRDPALQD